MENVMKDAKSIQEDLKNIKLPAWQLDATTPDEYHCCEMTRGREFLVRMMTGADPSLAIARFAKENNIRFGKVHATFMGGFQPCKYFVWIPDYANPENWHREGVASVRFAAAMRPSPSSPCTLWPAAAGMPPRSPATW